MKIICRLKIQQCRFKNVLHESCCCWQMENGQKEQQHTEEEEKKTWHVDGKNKLKVYKNRRQQHSHGHKFAVTPAHQAAYPLNYDQKMFRLELITNKTTIR